MAHQCLDGRTVDFPNFWKILRLSCSSFWAYAPRSYIFLLEWDQNSSIEEHLEGYLWKKIDVNVNAVLMALPRTSGTPYQNSVYKLEFASKFNFVRSVFYIIGMETVITFDLGVGQREIFFIVHKIIFLRKGISGGRFLEPFFFNINLENFWRYFD